MTGDTTSTRSTGQLTTIHQRSSISTVMMAPHTNVISRSIWRRPGCASQTASKCAAPPSISRATVARAR